MMKFYLKAYLKLLNFLRLEYRYQLTELNIYFAENERQILNLNMSTGSRSPSKQEMPKSKNYFEFNKLNDPNDTPFDKVYKRWFRYSSPSLFLFGPLAPAHDALWARVSMAVVQISFGAFMFYGSFRKYPQLSKTRRISARIGCFIGGGMSILLGNKEITNFIVPNENPLFIEISIARSIQETQGKGRGSYWFGPDNFMPMNTSSYTKMLSVMKLHKIMVDEYNESDITKRYLALAAKFKDDYDKKDSEMKFIDRINKIVDAESSDELEVHARPDAKPWFTANDTNSNIPSTKGEIFVEWAGNHPWEQLNNANLNYFLGYEFPSLLAEDVRPPPKKDEKLEEESK